MLSFNKTKKVAPVTLAEVLTQLLSGRQSRNELENALNTLKEQTRSRLYTARGLKSKQLTLKEADAVAQWMSTDQKKKTLTGRGYSIEVNEKTVVFQGNVGITSTLILKNGQFVSYEDQETGLINVELLTLIKSEFPIIEELITRLGLKMADKAVILIVRNREKALRNETNLARKRIAERKRDLRTLNRALIKITWRLRRRAW
jgi:hypothetical protein